MSDPRIFSSSEKKDLEVRLESLYDQWGQLVEQHNDKVREGLELNHQLSFLKKHKPDDYAAKTENLKRKRESLGKEIHDHEAEYEEAKQKIKTEVEAISTQLGVPSKLFSSERIKYIRKHYCK